jgi:hypothetical protein
MLTLNNKAVALMKDGAYVCAYKLLHSALEQLKSQVEMDSDEHPSTNLSSTPTAPVDVATQLLPVSVDYTASMERTELDPFAFYPCAFSFSGTEQAAANINDARTAAVIMYNFGLCFHVYGLNRPSPQYFLKALTMYTSALGLVEVASGTSGDAFSDHLLILALYNNIGHISSCEHKSHDTQMCLDRLRSILVVKAEQVERDMTYWNTPIPVLEYAGFHLNVIILHGTERHSPAA